MKNRILFLFLATFSLFLTTSCNDDDDDTMTSSFTLDINGLEDLGSEAMYEGWLIVDGSPITTGLFSVDSEGNLSKTEFEMDNAQLESASTFVLTIEPFPDNDPAPSDVHVLAGDFNGTVADLTVSHGAALGHDFKESMGKYLLATPTDGADNNEKSGLWFLDNSSGSPMPGLNLPTLPKGWIYEGWAVINGQPVSTGTFSEISGMDMSAPFSGMMAAPPFPGEDFIVNAPDGLSFPTDLSGGAAVISIEPVPDNSSAPFTLKPLVGEIPQNADDHVVYEMGLNLAFPSGMIRR